jgi:hypothetical protein
MKTQRSWRKRHHASDGAALHTVAVSVTTDVLNAVEELATRERVSRAWAGGKLVELGLLTRQQTKSSA